MGEMLSRERKGVEELDNILPVALLEWSLRTKCSIFTHHCLGAIGCY